jgi:hypothetical protein
LRSRRLGLTYPSVLLTGLAVREFADAEARKLVVEGLHVALAGRHRHAIGNSLDELGQRHPFGGTPAHRGSCFRQNAYPSLTAARG